MTIEMKLKKRRVSDLDSKPIITLNPKPYAILFKKLDEAQKYDKIYPENEDKYCEWGFHPDELELTINTPEDLFNLDKAVKAYEREHGIGHQSIYMIKEIKSYYFWGLIRKRFKNFSLHYPVSSTLVEGKTFNILSKSDISYYSIDMSKVNFLKDVTFDVDTFRLKYSGSEVHFYGTINALPESNHSHLHFHKPLALGEHRAKNMLFHGNEVFAYDEETFKQLRSHLSGTYISSENSSSANALTLMHKNKQINREMIEMTYCSKEKKK